VRQVLEDSGWNVVEAAPSSRRGAVTSLQPDPRVRARAREALRRPRLLPAAALRRVFVGASAAAVAVATRFATSSSAFPIDSAVAARRPRRSRRGTKRAIQTLLGTHAQASPPERRAPRASATGPRRTRGPRRRAGRRRVVAEQHAGVVCSVAASARRT
jgi:hypothetical protein